MESRAGQTLEPEKLNRNAAEENCASSQGMAVPLQLANGQKINSKTACEHNADHRQNGHAAEHGGHHNQTGGAMASGGIHHDRNKRFARAKDKGREQDPRGEIYSLLLLVHVSVFIAIGVRMDMLASVFVEMKVRVRPALDGTPNAPSQIDRTERNKRPSGDITPKRFQPLKLGDGNSKCNADQPQNNLAANMPEPAQESDPRSLGHRPLAGLGHHDKRKLMIRSGNSVNKSDRRSRNGQKI